MLATKLQLDGMTKDALVTLAQDLGISVTTKMLKAELIEAIKSAQEAAEEFASEISSAMGTIEAAQQNAAAEIPLTENEREEDKKEKTRSPQGGPVQTKKATQVRESRPKKKTPDAKQRRAITEAKEQSEYVKTVLDAKRTSRRRRPRAAAVASRPVTVEGDVFTQNPQDRFQKTLSQEEVLMNELKASYDKNAQVILTSTIAGYNTMEGTPMLFMLYGGQYRVNIPGSYFLEDYDPNKMDMMIARMRQRVGTQCSFIVTNISDDGEIIIGSRVLAMKKTRRNYWSKRVRGTDEDGNQLYALREGIKAEGTVVAVAHGGINVELFGKETVIFNDDLNWTYTEDARKDFSPGDIIQVMIKSVSERKRVRDKDGTLDLDFKFTASRKLCTEDPREKYFNMYFEGDDIRECTVTGTMVKNNTIRYYVDVNREISVLCSVRPSVNTIPVVGGKVDIRITNKYQNSLQFSGEITHNYSHLLEGQR